VPQLEDTLLRLAERHPPAGADHVIGRLESRLAESVRSGAAVLHAARVMALSAVTVLVFVGGVVAGRWLLGPGAAFDFGFGRMAAMTRTAADVSVLGVIVAAAAGGGVLLAGAAALAWTRHRRRVGIRALVDGHQGAIMETIDKTVERPEKLRRAPYRVNRWLVVGLIVAVAALVAVGAWLLIDSVVMTDYEGLIEDHLLAYNAGDSAAVAAMYTEDGVIVDGGGIEWRGKDLIAASVNHYARGNFNSEITGQMVTSGSFVAFPERATVGSATLEGITVVEFEGPLIKRWVVYGTRVFD